MSGALLIYNLRHLTFQSHPLRSTATTSTVDPVVYSTAMAPTTSHHRYPPFPNADLETAPLVSVSLRKLEDSDGPESQAFFDASRSLGFFYLDTKGSKLGEALISEAEQLHELEKQFFKLSNDEKEEFAREKLDPFFGYRHGNIELKDEDGIKGRNESYNVLLHY